MKHVNEELQTEFIKMIDDYIQSFEKNGLLLAALELGVSPAHLYKVKRGQVPLTQKFYNRVMSKLQEVEKVTYDD